MPYCPRCFTEYEEGTRECADCGIALEAGTPPKDEKARKEPKLVRLRVFSGPTAVMEADLARNLLQQQDVVSFVPGETSAEMLPGIDVVQLWVREEDADRANELLKSYFETRSDTSAVPEEIENNFPEK